MTSPHRRRAYAACAFCIGTSVAFFLTELVALPVPHYFPLTRHWALGPGAGLSMDYYGRSLLALLGGGAAALLSLLVSKLAPPRPPKGPARPVLFLCTAWAATALLLCASLYAYKLRDREVLPEPLPVWYQPR